MTIGLLALDRRHGPLLAAAFRQISENGKRKTENRIFTAADFVCR
jgi:hypothetical protein